MFFNIFLLIILFVSLSICVEQPKMTDHYPRTHHHKYHKSHGDAIPEPCQECYRDERLINHCHNHCFISDINHKQKDHTKAAAQYWHCMSECGGRKACPEYC